jgi:hypothetical protein
VLGEVLDEVNGRTSMDDYFTGVTGLFTTLRTSITGSPCSVPAGMSVMGLSIDDGQWFNSQQLFNALCVVRTWLESEQRIIPIIRLVISGIMVLGFGLLLFRMFSAKA